MDRVDLQHDAFKLNGSYLEDIISGYATAKAKGRESLAKDVETYTNGTDGETFRKSSFPERTITITYVVKGSSLADLRDKMHQLQTLLNVSEAEIIFNDDPNNYYTATPVMDSAPSEGKDAAYGTFSLICHDPFKYSKTLTSVAITTHSESVVDENGNTSTVTSNVLTTDNQGGYKTYPSFQIQFATDESAGGSMGSDADCGYVLFAKGGTNYSVQVGDDKEKDTGTTTEVAQDFRKSKGSFADSNTITPPFSTHVFQGSSKSETSATKGPGLKVSSYGSAISGKFYGPAVVYNIGHNVSGPFSLSWQQVIACANTTATGKKQAGSFWIMLLNSSNECVFGVGINKKSTSSLNATAYYYDKDLGLVEDGTYSLAYTNKAGFKNTSDTTGRLSTFKIVREQDESGDYWDTYVYTPYVSEASVSKSSADSFSKILIFFGKYSSANVLYTNRVASVELVNGDFDTINSFGSGDSVSVDCSKAEILLNNELNDNLGDVGNDWEDMTLDVGVNTIYVQWSDWVVSGYEPTVSMTYRKRWL